MEATHNALFISTSLKHMSWPDSCKPAGMDNQAKPMIMVVDDDADMLVVMTATLERQGYRVDARATPPNWIELQAVHPDVLFLDVELASSNGVLVCKSIKENLLNWKLPVVLTSGHGEYQLKRKPSTAKRMASFPNHSTEGTSSRWWSTLPKWDHR